MVMRRILPITAFFALATLAFVSCKDQGPYYDVRDEYIGDYYVEDTCDAFESDYNLTIFKEGNDNEIVFGFPGLYETGYEVIALVTGMKITIPIQQFVISSFPVEVLYEFSGSGSLDGNVLTVDYQVLTIQNGLIFDDVDCTANMVRTN
jgi:hypothetical protein